MTLNGISKTAGEAYLARGGDHVIRFGGRYLEFGRPWLYADESYRDIVRPLGTLDLMRIPGLGPRKAAILIKEALGLQKGSPEPNRNKVGKLTRAQVNQIAERKLPDLNAHTVEQAAKIIEGTARSMGVEVAG